MGGANAVGLTKTRLSDDQNPMIRAWIRTLDPDPLLTWWVT